MAKATTPKPSKAAVSKSPGAEVRPDVKEYAKAIQKLREQEIARQKIEGA